MTVLHAIGAERGQAERDAYERIVFRAFEDALGEVFGAATLDDAMRAVGVKPLPVFAEPSWSVLDPQGMEWAAFRDESRVLLAASQLEARGYDRVTLNQAMDAARTTLSVALQEEIGAPGTRYTRGIQQTEPNTLLRPFSIRGVNGARGLNDEAWRTDSGIFRHVNEHAAITCAATFEPIDSPTLDEDTRRIMRDGHAALMNVRGGFRPVKRHWATAIKEGFAISEVVWGIVGGIVAPVMLEPREASSVQGWLFDESRRTCVGAEFQSFGDGRSIRYALPNGETPTTCRMAVVRLNASGSEMEGVSPIRPVLALRKMKELILQCAGIAYQKHGVPIATVALQLVDATIAELGQVGTEQHRSEITKVITRLKDIRARVGPVLPLPVGVTVDYVVPANEMPDPRPLLEWIDLAIAQAFANEGALLGSGSGSYGLAAAKESAFLRSAPAYAEAFCETLEQLMRVIILANHPAPAEVLEFPSYGFRFAGSQDNTRWVNDLATLQNAGIGGMSQVIQETAASRLGLPADAFGQMPDRGNAGQPAPDKPTPDGRSADDRQNAEEDNRVV